tara:strand:+ start:367 stop:1419 length:1053 start_codon:yes stop_codon:yes gene_type:complete
MANWTPTPTSGAISMSDVNLLCGKSATTSISMSNLYDGGGHHQMSLVSAGSSLSTGDYYFRVQRRQDATGLQGAGTITTNNNNLNVFQLNYLATGQRYAFSAQTATDFSFTSGNEIVSNNGYYSNYSSTVDNNKIGGNDSTTLTQVLFQHSTSLCIVSPGSPGNGNWSPWRAASPTFYPTASGTLTSSSFQGNAYEDRGSGTWGGYLEVRLYSPTTGTAVQTRSVAVNNSTQSFLRSPGALKTLTGFNASVVAGRAYRIEARCQTNHGHGPCVKQFTVTYPGAPGWYFHVGELVSAGSYGSWIDYDSDSDKTNDASYRLAFDYYRAYIRNTSTSLPTSGALALSNFRNMG